MRNSIIVILFFLVFQSFSQSDIEKGIQLFEHEKYAEAIPFFKNVLKTDTGDSKVMEYLGDCYGHLKNWDLAIEQYKQLAYNNPNVANYHYKYGGVLAMKAQQNKLGSLGLLDTIEEEFKKAAELDPNHVDVRWALVQYYTELPAILGGRQSKALVFANELETISKVDGYLAKGYIYKVDGDFEKAEDNFKKAVVVGGSITCYDKLIELYTLQKKYDKALDTIKQAHLKLKVNNYCYRYGKMAAEKNVKVSEGISQLQSYIDNFGAGDSYTLEWAYLRLAQLYKYQQNKEKALYWVGKSINQKPDFKVAQKEKSKILKI